MSTEGLLVEDFARPDLAQRWRRARIAALQLGVKARQLESEELLLAQVALEDQGPVLRAVFDNSRKLGISHACHFGIVWELSDFRSVLPELGVPCVIGAWETRENSLVLNRVGCKGAHESQPRAFYCDYWREAIDGLVMGVSEDERFVRHASRGHGDETCTDVFFKDVPVTQKQPLLYAPISETMQNSLDEIRTRLLGLRAEVEFKGISEGTLYYYVKTPSGDKACGAGGKILHEHLRKMIALKWPHLAIQDTSPLAVYGERA
jgi:hypothetical protein